MTLDDEATAAVETHTSFAIALQVDLGTLDHAGATLGIQNRDARLAHQYVPPGSLTGTHAICFLEPRFPFGGLVADLSVTKAVKNYQVGEQQVTYEIIARNAGPSPVEAGASVSDGE